MFFQQWSKSAGSHQFRELLLIVLPSISNYPAGINAILYYAPSIFHDLSLTGNAISLLATGVVGIVYTPSLCCRFQR